MLAVSFHVRDWAAISGGRLQRAASAGARAEKRSLPMLLRRRLTPLGQAAISAAYEVGADAGIHYVFASRHGEFQRSLRLLETLAAKQPLSPADFSLCVHNALPGLLSIATNAHAGHTAIAAGPDSLAAGLIEAAALLAHDPGTPVLLVYFDDDLPTPYDVLQIERISGPMALAVLLALPEPEAEAVHFQVTPQAAPFNPNEALPGLAFLRFLAEELSSARASGARLSLEWRRAA